MNKFVSSLLKISGILILFVLVDNIDAKGRDSNQRLFPFPRVGRGQDSRYLSRNEEGKISLFAFPRIGRSEQPLPKRSSSSSNNGLWFGPRLGRVQKRDIYVYDLPHNYPREIVFTNSKYNMDFPDYPETRNVHYTPRLGRESSEQQEEDAEE
ncbi:PREDICTED: cardio acceleratory peptide 2b [Nicrophorus vespilloides]|uniref:Cardio acceleratory peptide 2b n=1 Tax=Nicrophorus vespilloides TaxID=110193 RepID=A0ABM1MF90_NICVS|nr:PREDICTED: cardio acceleratory peptide 2b [Nicrophorus vespilloides]